MLHRWHISGVMEFMKLDFLNRFCQLHLVKQLTIQKYNIITLFHVHFYVQRNQTVEMFKLF